MEKHVFENDTQSDKTMDESNSIYIPSKSDSQSYREKIRKRFKLIKEHAGSVAVCPKSFTGSIRLLKEENEQVRITFDKFIHNRGNYSKTDCYHFFCEETVDNRTSIDENEEIGGSADNYEIVVQNLSPEVLQDFLELAMTNSLWYPGRFLIDFNSKSKDNICSITEEGLYVPEQRKVPHIGALEQRLALDDMKWFNSQGNLKLIESPISGRCYRPGYTDTDRYSTNFVLPKDATLDVKLDSISVHRPRIIQIHIFEIRFQHHSLFSVEHVIERKLLQLFNSYKEKNDTNKLERISKKLDYLRKKMLNCGDAEFGKYTSEITKLRKLQISESFEHRTLIKEILRVWKLLKKIREDKHFSNTNTKLLIYKENTDYEAEVKHFEDNINTTTEEIIREQTEEYQRKLEKYKTDLQIWSNDKAQKRPKKPTNEIDENQIRDNVRRDLLKAFKLPGEPIITLDISTENIITDKIESELENSRRQAVRCTKIFVNVLFNGIDVGKSVQINMNDTFTCTFNEAFSLQVKDVPKNLIFQIYERPPTMTERLIAKLEVNISSISSKNKPNVQNFKKEELIHYNHDGIGSGCDLKDIYEKYNYPLLDDERLDTCGSIIYSVFCKDEDDCYTNSAYSPTKICENQLFSEEGRIDPAKLAQWTSLAEIDPQNPKNTVLFEYINAYKKHQYNMEASPTKYFRCNPEMNTLIFYDAATIENNVRFQVLELRSNNEPEFAGMIVPNRLKEIPVNILSSYNKRIREEHIRYDFDERENIEARISKGQKYLKLLHIKIFQQCKSITSNLTYEDVVNEKLLSYFQSYIKVLVLNFLNWFKLRPGVNKPFPQLATAQDHIVNESIQNISTKLFITIVSAINIPNKLNFRKTVKNRSSQNFEIMNVQPQQVYVTVSYDDMVLKTTTKEGSNPVWEEDMIFPLRATSIDYMSPNALNGSIMVNLFVSLIDRDEKQIGCNWLGFIKIPLSAVAQSSKMEGFFLLKSPVFLNYEQNLIYLNLKLKIQPQFPKLYLNMKELRSSEPPYLQDYLNKWNNDFNESCTQNNFSVLAVDSTGRTVCLTRFIRQLEPPQINSNDFDVTPEQCARFVSLIPFTECNKIYENMWLTTKELLRLMAGSVIDHSIALTCFFLALNMEAWLLLGYGIPWGATGFVLTREYDNNVPIHYIYDSSSGFKYSLTDPLCPLQRVFCVVNETNIWANVQRTHDIALLQFDFNRRSDWHRVFTNQMPAPTNSMQHKLSYYRCSNSILQDLQFQIEKKLRKAILKYRRTEKTTWNHYISNQLKIYISNIENNYTCNRFDISHFKGIEHLQSVYGFVMNLPYTNISTLLDIIRASQIFDIGGSEKEYLFGIHFHGYPNHVIVIWIIIGFILPNKN